MKAVLDTNVLVAAYVTDSPGTKISPRSRPLRTFPSSHRETETQNKHEGASTSRALVLLPFMLDACLDGVLGQFRIKRDVKSSLH